jgi:DNA modification methylase
MTERACLGIEIDTKYVDVIVARWQEITGKQATLYEDGRTFEAIQNARLKEVL